MGVCALCQMSIPYITVISSPEKAAPLTLMRLAL
jgi:hypothetical protein